MEKKKIGKSENRSKTEHKNKFKKKGEEKEVEIRSLFWNGKTEERIRLGGDD